MSKQTEIRIKVTPEITEAISKMEVTPEITEAISKMEVTAAQKLALKRAFGSCTSDREGIVKGALEDTSARLKQTIIDLGVLLVLGYMDYVSEQEAAEAKAGPVHHFISGDYLSIKQNGHTLQLRVSDAVTFMAALEQHKAKTEAEIAHHQRELGLINAVLEGKSTSDPEALR